MWSLKQAQESQGVICGLVEKESSKTVKFNGAGARKDRTSPW
jgi:hypothetical protein